MTPDRQIKLLETDLDSKKVHPAVNNAFTYYRTTESMKSAGG